MKWLIVTAALTTLMLTAANAETVDDCAKSWNSYDISRDGYLAGDEAKRFRDDMSIQGVSVGKTKDDRISANQYNHACIKNFWETFEEDQ